MTATYPCSRCAGYGQLRSFSNVLGGVCFKCKGSGQQKSKTSQPSPLWAVFGQTRDTSEWTRLYNIKAKTDQAAISKARETMARASTEWRATYTLDEARAIKVADMADPSAITWQAATQ